MPQKRGNQAVCEPMAPLKQNSKHIRVPKFSTGSYSSSRPHGAAAAAQPRIIHHVMCCSRTMPDSYSTLEAPDDYACRGVCGNSDKPMQLICQKYVIVKATTTGSSSAGCQRARASANSTTRVGTEVVGQARNLPPPLRASPALGLLLARKSRSLGF